MKAEGSGTCAYADARGESRLHYHCFDPSADRVLTPRADPPAAAPPRLASSASALVWSCRSASAGPPGTAQGSGGEERGGAGGREGGKEGGRAKKSAALVRGRSVATGRSSRRRGLRAPRGGARGADSGASDLLPTGPETHPWS